VLVLVLVLVSGSGTIYRFFKLRVVEHVPAGVASIRTSWRKTIVGVDTRWS
jgi:hypothetical protein